MYWFSQTIGPGRGLELAVRAIAMSRSRPHFFIRGNPVPGYVEYLQKLAAKTGIEEHLHFLEPCEPTELERLGSVYDIGFVGEQALTQNRQIALTNKLFSYLTSGIPIVASDISAHQEVSHRFFNAIKLFKSDDPESLACCLDKYLMNPIELQDAKVQARRLAQREFNWENEEQKHMDVVLANLSGTGC
jgi:glycosyltransferase involved in cell wall biosynthesis